MPEPADILALRALAERYALAADTGDGPGFAALFVAEGEVLAPRGHFVGQAALAGIPAMLKARYRGTFHAVFNQVAQIDGDGARAETYSIARHFLETDAGRCCYEMTIRYHDSFARGAGGWRFTRRDLGIVATRTFPVDPLPAEKDTP